MSTAAPQPSRSEDTPAVFDDKDVIDDHALRRARLVGSANRGLGWRRRREPSISRFLIAGLIVALIITFVAGATAFVQHQLERRQSTQLNPAPRALTLPLPPVDRGPLGLSAQRNRSNTTA